MTDNVLGIDVNHYRKNVPTKQAKSQGVRFLIGKCTEGLSLVDETYEPYKLESKNRNLPFGGYMYWRVIFDAAKQAKHFVDSLGDTDFPPIVDMERYLNRIYGTNTPLRPISFNRNHFRIVLNEVERLSGRKPMIYTNFASWRTIMGDWDLIRDYPLWVASWGRTVPYLPLPATQWTLHQFTSTYKVEGYYRGLDANYYNGNEADFEAWLAAMKPPPPPPPDTPHPVEYVHLEFKGEKWEGLLKKIEE